MGAAERLQEAGDARPDRAAQRAGDDRERGCGRARAGPGSDEPTQTAMIAPARYWPWPPMLNMPQRNANATARPVSTSGTQMISVCWRLSAERDSKSFVFQGNGMYASVKGIRSSYDPTSRNQLKPAPSKIALYVLSGFLPGRDEDDEAADEEGEDHRQERDGEPARLLGEREPRGDARRRVVRDPAPAAERRERLLLAQAACLPAAADHRDAELLLGDARRELAHDLALEDDEDPVGEREDLLELERDEQDAAALVALLDEPAVDELDRADVEPARRLGGDQHLRVAVDLAREDHLLLVAAGEPAQRASAGRRRGRRTRGSACAAFSSSRSG